jgi:hypothetical protein
MPRGSTRSAGIGKMELLKKRQKDDLHWLEIDSNLDRIPTTSELEHHRPIAGIEALVSIIEDEEELLKDIGLILEEVHEKLRFNNSKIY